MCNWGYNKGADRGEGAARNFGCADGEKMYNRILAQKNVKQNTQVRTERQ